MDHHPVGAMQEWQEHLADMTIWSGAIQWYQVHGVLVGEAGDGGDEHSDGDGY